jgi:hypothetical protein
LSQFWHVRFSTYRVNDSDREKLRWERIPSQVSYTFNFEQSERGAKFRSVPISTIIAVQDLILDGWSK